MKVAQEAGPVRRPAQDVPWTGAGPRQRSGSGGGRPGRGRDEGSQERTVWLATSAYAAMVGMLLLLLGRGKLSDPETMGGIAGGVLALVLLGYAFRRVLSVRSAALAGTTSRPARGMLVLLGTLTGITLACVVVGAVTG